jgi:hypothetical protein
MQTLGNKLGKDYKTVAVSQQNWRALCELSRHESFNEVIGRLVSTKSASRSDNK